MPAKLGQQRLAVAIELRYAYRSPVDARAPAVGVTPDPLVLKRRDRLAPIEQGEVAELGTDRDRPLGTRPSRVRSDAGRIDGHPDIRAIPQCRPEIPFGERTSADVPGAEKQHVRALAQLTAQAVRVQDVRRRLDAELQPAGFEARFRADPIEECCHVRS